MKTCFCSITRITYCNFSSLDYNFQNSLFFLSNYSHWIEISLGLLNINSIEGKTKCVLEVVDKIADCFNLNKYLVRHGLAIKQNKNIFCGTLRRFWKWGFERKNVIVWKHQALWLVAWSWMVLHGPFIIIVGNYIAKIFLPSENLESNPSIRPII